MIPESGGTYMDNGASSYRRFLDGDESAFNEIMEELFRSLVFFINGYVHDIHAAEDIAIDAFSDLVVHRHRYNFKVTLKTYVFMLGRSRALDYIKHRKVLSLSNCPKQKVLRMKRLWRRLSWQTSESEQYIVRLRNCRRICA